ncbi:MAG: Crp/Fnr family transcriptional regulator [Firmicutes bacterium]|nr:Crp/Fnr family transcriptional regulator [Bacillota bacterium]
MINCTNKNTLNLNADKKSSLKSSLGLNSMESMIIKGVGYKEHYHKGQVIFAAGDKGDHVYLIESGWVKVYRISAEGRNVSVGIRNPGELMGLADVMLGEDRKCFSGAISSVSLLVIPEQEFKKLMDRHPTLAKKVIKLLSARLCEAETLVQGLVCREASSRLALFLMNLCEKMGEQTQNGIRINLHLTHEEIANMVGTTRQTVTSLINIFKQENIVIYEGRAIRIIHPDKLLNWVI